MPTFWDDAAVSKLFSAVLAAGEVTVDVNIVAAYMGTSSRAVKDQMARMKKKCDINVSGAETPKSGGKRKAAKDTVANDEKTTKKPKGRKKAAVPAAGNDDEEDMDSGKAEEDAGVDSEGRRDGEEA